jgi:hypothetical protein
MPFANDCLDLVGVCPNQLQSLTVGQNTEGGQTFKLVDPNGRAALDLTPYLPLVPSSSSSSSSEEVKHGVELYFKGWYTDTEYLSRMAEVRTAEEAMQGIIHFQIDNILSGRAGIWIGMAALWDHGVQRKNIPFYFEVEPSLNAQSSQVYGPLQSWELRLGMRDVCPEGNFLIDSVEFNNHELMWAIRRPIEYWNEALPPVAIYTMETFPYRYNWLNASVAELLLMAALWMRRNDLDYSAAGLQILDTKKWPDYHRLGTERRMEYQKWVRERKIAANVENAFETMTGYRSNPYR